MSRAEILDRLASLRRWLAERGVVRLRLFGSFARDLAGPNSDIDLIADLSLPMGLEFFQLEADLAALGRKVDLVTEAAMAADIRYRALQEAVDA